MEKLWLACSSHAHAKTAILRQLTEAIKSQDHFPYPMHLKRAAHAKRVVRYLQDAGSLFLESC